MMYRSDDVMLRLLHVTWRSCCFCVRRCCAVDSDTTTRIACQTRVTTRWWLKLTQLSNAERPYDAKLKQNRKIWSIQETKSRACFVAGCRWRFSAYCGRLPHGPFGEKSPSVGLTKIEADESTCLGYKWNARNTDSAVINDYGTCRRTIMQL